MPSPRPGYCNPEDLLLGDMTLSSAISPEKFIADSADEIDVRISRVYITPVDLASPELENSAKLTLKIANARLASGRMLMAQAQAAQDESLHAYAMYLIGEAETTIASIENSRLPLDGAPIRTDLLDTPAPIVSNLDAESPVEAFYGEFFGGQGSLMPTSPIWRPHGGG